MAEHDGQERTEQPTPKRLREAREKGQVPRSRELNTLAVLMAGGGTFLVLGSELLQGMVDLFRDGLSLPREALFDPHALTDLLAARLGEALWSLAPFFLVVTVAALIAPLALGGWSFSPAAAAPKFERIDPLKGLKRVFSVRGLVEMLKALAKFAVVGLIAVLLLRYQAGQLIGLSGEPLHAAMGHAGDVLSTSFIALCAGLVLVAAVDVPFQLWQHTRQLRMTQQEVRDELKETEGKPEVRARLRGMQREIAQRRMMEEVPKADVVVTNPTHYAVALRYDQLNGGAPRVIAKGRDLIAAQIRERASAHRIPVLEAPPLARALYFSTKLNREIPAGLYLAVAQVLAYVYRLKTATRARTVKPRPPRDLPVPEEFLRAANEADARARDAESSR